MIGSSDNSGGVMVGALACGILYSWKIWRGIKLGGLAVFITTAKLKSTKIPTHIYTYGDPVPNRQIKNLPIFLQ